MDLHRIDLNLLVALDALIAERSVTRAAKRLSVGQSAMSSSLGRLRKTFRDPILVQEGRQLVATPLAESLQAPLREVLTGVQALLTTGREFDPSVDGRVFTVVASNYVSLSFLHPLMVRLSNEAPQIRFNVLEPSGSIEDQLRQGQADMVILPREVFPKFDDFQYSLLFTDRYVCAFDAQHPTLGETISVEEFSEQPYLAVSVGTLPTYVEMQLDRLGVERHVEVTTGIGLAPYMLQGTRLITLVSHRLAHRFAESAGLRIVEPPFDLPPIHMTMIWAPRFEQDAGHRWLREACLALAAGMDPLPD